METQNIFVIASLACWFSAMMVFIWVPPRRNAFCSTDPTKRSMAKLGVGLFVTGLALFVVHLILRLVT
jgi:hypothetical protein